jgi:hypothetical protein
VSLNLGTIFELDGNLYATAPNSGDRSIVMIQQGVIATAAFDALNKTIDSTAKL